MSISAKILLFILLTFAGTRASAVVLTWADVPDGRLYRINTQQQTLEMEVVADRWQKIGNVLLKNVEERDFPPNARVKAIEMDKNRLRYLMVDCTNQVYTFDFETRILERIDKTFYRGNNCISTKFLRKDTLFSVGGYGFWRTNNLLTFFKRDSREFETLNSETNPPNSIYYGLNAYWEQEDTFFSALNYYHNDAENKGSTIFDYDAYQFSFRERHWQKVGTIQPDLFKGKENSFIGSIVWTGQYFLIPTNFNKPQLELLMADPRRNKLSLWVDTERVFDKTHFEPEGNPFNLYVWHDTLYYYKKSTTVKDTLVHKIKVPISELKRKATYVSKLYEPVTPMWYSFVWIAGLLIIMGLGVFWLYNQRNKKGQLLNHFKGVEKSFLEALIEASPQKGLSAEQVNQLLNTEKKSPETQRQTRSKFKNQLNMRIESLTGIKEAIEDEKNNSDGRMKDYFLKPQAIEKLRNK